MAQTGRHGGGGGGGHGGGGGGGGGRGRGRGGRGFRGRSFFGGGWGGYYPYYYNQYYQQLAQLQYLQQLQAQAALNPQAYTPSDVDQLRMAVQQLTQQVAELQGVVLGRTAAMVQPTGTGFAG